MYELINKVMDKLKKEIRFNRNIFIFLTILMIIAIISGSLFSLVINSSDKKQVAEYLNNFFNNLSLEKLNYINILINSISGNLFLDIIIWLLGFSIIGIPVIIFIYFSKIFSIGFTFSNLIINYKIKGLLYSIFYLIPYGLLIIISYVILINYALSVSCKLFSSIVKKKSIDFKPIITKYLKALLVAIIFIVLASLTECFIMPFIFKIITLIGK